MLFSDFSDCEKREKNEISVFGREISLELEGSQLESTHCGNAFAELRTSTYQNNLNKEIFSFLLFIFQIAAFWMSIFRCTEHYYFYTSARSRTKFRNGTLMT